MTLKELKRNGQTLIPRLEIANTFFSRFWGLMGKKNLDLASGILFPNCNSIHTFFMKFPIDVILLSREGRVVEIREAVNPWGLLLPVKQASHVIELSALSAKNLGIFPGEKLDCEGIF